MKKLIFLLILSGFLAAFSGCEDNDPPISTEVIPACINQKVVIWKK